MAVTASPEFLEDMRQLRTALGLPINANQDPQAMLNETTAELVGMINKMSDGEDIQFDPAAGYTPEIGAMIEAKIGELQGSETYQKLSEIVESSANASGLLEKIGANAKLNVAGENLEKAGAPAPIVSNPALLVDLVNKTQGIIARANSSLENFKSAPQNEPAIVAASADPVSAPENYTLNAEVTSSSVFQDLVASIDVSAEASENPHINQLIELKRQYDQQEAQLQVAEDRYFRTRGRGAQDNQEKAEERFNEIKGELVDVMDKTQLAMAVVIAGMSPEEFAQAFPGHDLSVHVEVSSFKVSVEPLDNTVSANAIASVATATATPVVASKPDEPVEPMSDVERVERSLAVLAMAIEEQAKEQGHEITVHKPGEIDGALDADSQASLQHVLMLTQLAAQGGDPKAVGIMAILGKGDKLQWQYTPELGEQLKEMVNNHERGDEIKALLNGAQEIKGGEADDGLNALIASLDNLHGQGNVLAKKQLVASPLTTGLVAQLDGMTNGFLGGFLGFIDGFMKQFLGFGLNAFIPGLIPDSSGATPRQTQPALNPANVASSTPQNAPQNDPQNNLTQQVADELKSGDLCGKFRAVAPIGFQVTQEQRSTCNNDDLFTGNKALNDKGYLADTFDAAATNTGAKFNVPNMQDFEKDLEEVSKIRFESPSAMS